LGRFFCANFFSNFNLQKLMVGFGSAAPVGGFLHKTYRGRGTAMKGLLLAIFLLTLVAGCGGGGGGDQAPGIIDWEGTYNDAGFPEVAGVYSFVSGERSYTCGSDPFVRTLPGVNMILRVLQSEDQLRAENQGTDSDPDYTIVDFTELAGSIETDGYFALAQTVVYTVEGFEGQFTVENELKGLFTVSGWNGDYRYSVSNDLTETTCNYSSRFSGERSATGPSAAVHALSSPPAVEDPIELAPVLLGYGR
jgi:hypothetical protein